MTYQSRLKEHLADYKRSRLRVAEPGIFHYRGRNILCDHILPRSNEWLNILPLARPAVQAFLTANPNKRHRYFHHLNSSQAFAFNLFFPFFEGNPQSAAALLRALTVPGVFASWEPEAVPNRAEGTNIDARWTTTDGVQTFCEVKLSEAELGKASDDERHRRKLRQIYEPQLAGHLASPLLECPGFLAAYQFVRNIWHMVGTPGSRLVFLVPRSNESVWSALEELLLLVQSPTRGRIARIAVEDVLDSLRTDGRCPPRLRRHADDLTHKYVIGRTT